MDYTKASDKMVKARAALIMEQRFFGSLALKLIFKEDPGCETMWTDGVSLGYDPTFVFNLGMDELKACIAHEVMHCSAGHPTRRKERDHEDWNVATDLAINDIIKQAGLHLPSDALFNPKYKDQSADTIYADVHGKRPKQQQTGDSGQGQGQGGQSQDAKQGQGQGKGKGKPQQGGDPGKCGEVRDFPGANGPATESELQQQAQDWQIATAQAAKVAKDCGSLPGNLAELVKELLEPKVSWREVLQRFVEQISKNDYTWTRPNPRYAPFGVILPSLYNKELPPIHIYVDTSGSVGSDEKKQFFGEIDDIRHHYRTIIQIIYCDTAVREVVTVEPDDELKELSMKGGGGTRFSPAIKYSMDSEDKPCCGIYLTDMQCSDFGPEPEFPVLWIQTKGRKKTPPFGELVHMNLNPF